MGRAPARWTVPLAALGALAAVGDRAGRIAGRRMAFDGAAFERLCGSAEYRATRIAGELGFRARCDLRSALPEMVRALDGDGPN